MDLLQKKVEQPPNSMVFMGTQPNLSSLELGDITLKWRVLRTYALFVWLISHQPAVFFSQPSATSQQYFSLRTNQHQSLATSQTNMLLHV
jgi:hypothetical protein